MFFKYSSKVKKPSQTSSTYYAGEEDFVCSHCKSQEVVEDGVTGDVTCRKCTVVLEERLIDYRSEWRTFANDGSKQGADQNRIGAGFSISSLPVDITGISSMDQSDGKSRSANSNSAEQTRYRINSEIIRICNHNEIPYDVTERAQNIYADVDGDKELKGKPTDHIIAACILQASRELKVMRTLQEVACMTNVPRNKIVRVLNIIRKVAKVDSYTPLTGDQFMSRYCANFGWTEKIILRTSQLYDYAQQHGFVNGAKCPISVAAACAYIVTQLVDGPKAKKPAEVSEQFGIRDATLIQAYNDLYQHRHVLVQTHFPEIPKGVASLAQHG